MNYLQILPEQLFPLYRTKLSKDTFSLLSKLKFNKATLPEHINLPSTYMVKPAVVSINNNITFAEIAVVELFRKEGWNAYWVDTFHHKVWTDFLERENENILPSSLLTMFKKIKDNLDSRGGRWDIVAIKGEVTLFLECKAIPSHDKIRPFQIKWMKEAIKLGIPKENFIIIEWNYM